MSFSSVTCVYTINASGQLTPAQIALIMGALAVPIPAEFLALTGAAVTSDNSVAGATSASAHGGLRHHLGAVPGPVPR